MRQLLAIIKNTCLQTMRQPIYGLIVVVTLGGMALLPSLTGWSLDDDNKMLRDMGLSTLLMQGLFLAVFAAGSVIDAEIEDKTVLTVVAKPISRITFILGKFGGVFVAVLAAHYLATVAYLMTMRHGVMQTASDTVDWPVLVFGVGLMLLAMIAATALNYLYERRFLPTVVMLALPTMTLGGALLLLIDKEWKFGGYVTRQTMDDLPADIAAGVDFKGFIEFWPRPGNAMIAGHNGWLVRKNFKGPISDSEQEYLLGLSPSQHWKKEVNFLVQECRKIEGPELVKAAILILLALMVLAALSIACSTRLGMMATLLIAILALWIGLSADQVFKPWAEEHRSWASALYPLLPNFQFFWMIDALSDERVIPCSFIGQAAIYAVLYSAALLAAGMSLFETREVG
jgi:hypothetical protein